MLRSAGAFQESTVSDTHKDEYDENVTAMLELIWGKGFMAPGGEGNVRRIVEGLELAGKSVLEIGCGLGGGALLLASQYDASVIGLEVEAPLVDRARTYASEAGMDNRVEFKLVEPGPLEIDDASIDVVYSSGVFIHIEDKSAIFSDVFRVLKPGGVLTAYDWLKGPGPLSQAMHEWMRLEELTYHLDTLDNYASMLRDSGFEEVTTTDTSSWYAAEAQREYEQMKGPLYNQMTNLVGDSRRDHFLDDWAAMVRVLESGELRTGYFRALKPS